VTSDDVVERIRKLLRLAGDVGATEAEAAAALERANALLMRHNLTLDRIAASTGAAAVPSVTEQAIRAGWRGNWRASLIYILAKHNLCEPFSSLVGRVESVVVVGRPANVAATHAMFDWIVAQLERFAQAEWLAFDCAQREAVGPLLGRGWCVECEDWRSEDEAYVDRSGLQCDDCDMLLLSERPPVRAFTWKTAFFRGALVRIKNRLYDQRTEQQAHGARVTALMLRTDQENQDFIARRHGDLREVRSRRRGYHAGAYQRGHERGGDVSLAPSPRLKPRGSSAQP
jgi:Protein of unknown function (DUF2786)